ncbi:MAG: CADD family putative folate metabolism protein [Parachlamydiaceae bacterium]
MNKSNSQFMNKLDALIQEHHMLSHPFYKAWTCGHLKQSTLMEYAKEYYHHVKAFPTYLSAVHSRSDDAQVRRLLLENLIDEEAGKPNHPDLWRSFAIALGLTKQEVETHQPESAAKKLVDTFRDICRNEPIAAGIAALYCYESQIPAICTTKIDGLKQWYGMTNPGGYHYFTVHETADVEHSRVERQLLESMVSPEDEDAVMKSAQRVLSTLWDFLSSFKI